MKRSIIRVSASGLLIGLLLIPQIGTTAEKVKTPLEQGKELSIKFCQACHFFEGTNQAGTLGPPLLAMKPRFPESMKLEKIIYDPHSATKPDSMMPPFGRNGLLNKQQIQLIIDYLYTL
ncbi:MAG: sulfur oxidation c-type cytochrome SoxX [Gammaproteobacteria bacterium]|nr:sulfur oxidation c-type cytochrome SoxX [Gammaproteobacteria bacterium]